MRFSIIAPCLNEEKNLPVFLDSLVAQSFKDFHVVIVDGFSEDRSLRIIQSYMHKLNICVILDGKRNFGYLRNRGAQASEAEIMFHGSVDTYFDSNFLEKLNEIYMENPNVVSVAGRTYPLGTNIFAHLSYQIFDFLRYSFTRLPFPAKKFRPSGNFTSYRSFVWKAVNGYEEVTVNEDGLMGQRIECYARQKNKKMVFSLNLWVGHHVRRFEQMGGIRAILFYLYTLTNLFPVLKPLLKHVEFNAAKIFEKGR